jgi:hypothetical protein
MVRQTGHFNHFVEFDPGWKTTNQSDREGQNSSQGKFTELSQIKVFRVFL